ncbi:MAG TPA: GEVED domain-containing protein [Bacteroidia bacterium]|nr:GEVED domain-containing protein [Bacteroidia bacterium]
MKTKNKFIKLLVLGMSFLSLNTNAQVVYCASSAASTFDDEIFNVTVGTLNNTSTCAQTGGPGSILNRYSDYTNATPSVAAPLLVLGQNYTASVTVGQCNGYAYGGYFCIWIDYNQNGLFTDPGENVYTSPYNTWQVAGTTMAIPGGITIPLTATPGITRMRVSAAESTIPGPCTNFSWGEVEDYNVNISSGVPCAGNPAANSVITPTAAICPNASAPLSLANQYTVGGITYQWQYSNVSAVGPWTTIPGATLSAITSPTLPSVAYFSTIITCTNSNGSVTATSGTVLVQPTTTNTVPYYESFEGISGANKLPNCSWIASNMPATCQTYTAPTTITRIPNTGSKFASFYYSPSSNNYFWSNGVWLEAGVTYSASMWYITEYYGYNTWNLRMYVGPNQSTVNASMIASQLPAASPSYKSLSNTFTVANSGLYYVGINGQSTGSSAQYLSWDDLRIEVPCQLNTPAVAITANSQTICSGQGVNLSATGATSYQWNTGSTSSAISVSPNVSTSYVVTGTNAASGCTANATQMITVNQSPVVSAIASQPTLCAGKSTNLLGFGANSYVWNNNATTPMITVSPTVTTTYSVIGTNAAGCSSTGTVQVVVNPNPNVTISSSNANNLACPEDQTTLTGNNAVTFQWTSSSSFMMGSPVVVSPNSSTTYTVVGTNANGCQGTATYQLIVTDCTGLKDVTTTQNGVKLYPNPTSGEFVVEIHNKTLNSVQVTDLTGRIVYNNSSKNEKISIDLGNYANGVYYVKVSTDQGSEVIKVVKQ